MVTLFSNIEGAKEKLLSSLFSIDFKTFLSYVTLDRKKKSSLVLVTLELINIYIYLEQNLIHPVSLFSLTVSLSSSLFLQLFTNSPSAHNVRPLFTSPASPRPTHCR